MYCKLMQDPNGRQGGVKRKEQKGEGERGKGGGGGGGGGEEGRGVQGGHHNQPLPAMLQ